MVTAIYTRGDRFSGRSEMANTPPKLNRVLNIVSSVLTRGNRLTIGQNDVKIRLKMIIRSRRRTWIGSLGVLFLVLGLTSTTVFSQKLVDKTVATVSDGFRAELITLSDLRWQIALQPNSRRGPYSSEELNAALQTLIDQRIFSLEANRLPRNPVSKKEIDDEIARVMVGLTAAEFESRLRDVGFTSVSDLEFQRIIEDRIATEKYVTFRFRSFIVVTAKDVETHYRDVFVPEFRRRYPGLLMPTLEEKRADIRNDLIELRVAADIQTFLDNAKQRVSVVIISPV